MSATILYFPDSQIQSEALAAALGLPAALIAVHHFPDGESLVRVPPDVRGSVILVRSLHDPNSKLIELMLACATLREQGVQRIVLIAPYLAYMRQDMAFHPGEAVSQRHMGRWLADLCDVLVTVDPHLHRVPNLQNIVPERLIVTLSAAPLLGQMLRDTHFLLVGPDSESQQWVSQMAAPFGLDMVIAQKARRGDRDVEVMLPPGFSAQGRHAVIVDDVISSGHTLRACATALWQAGAVEVEALATHCLASAADYQALLDHGFAQVRATDSIIGPWTALSLAPLIAEALRTHHLV